MKIYNLTLSNIGNMYYNLRIWINTPGNQWYSNKLHDTAKVF
jgi:hypothetical protein